MSTLWQKEINEAENGNPNGHFYDDVRGLTKIIEDLREIASDKISNELQSVIDWYFADSYEEGPSKKECSCDPRTLLNFGCQC